MGKSGEMGIGALILFISLVLVAAIAAGVLIQTTGSLQEKALTTGDQAKGQISTNMKVVDLTVEKDSNSEYRNLKMIVKVAPGSDPIDLNKTIVSLSLYDISATLSYRENGTTDNNPATGFNTYGTQEIGEIGVYTSQPGSDISTNPVNIPHVDYDYDGNTDTIKICCDGPAACVDPVKNDDYSGNSTREGWMEINVSSKGYFYIQVNDSGNNPIALCMGTGVAAVNKSKVGDMGYITVWGDLGGVGIVPWNRVWFYQNETWLTQDLDKDGNSSDYLYVNQTHAIFFWTNGERDAVPLGSDISVPVLLDNEAKIGYGTGTYKGKLSLHGTTTRSDYIQEGITFTVSPVSITGNYVSQYLQEASNSRAGILRQGDVVRLYMQLPRSLTEDEKVLISLIPKRGTPTRLETYSPNVMSETQISLYP